MEALDLNLSARDLRWYRYSQLPRATTVSHLLPYLYGNMTRAANTHIYDAYIHERHQKCD